MAVKKTRSTTFNVVKAVLYVCGFFQKAGSTRYLGVGCVPRQRYLAELKQWSSDQQSSCFSSARYCCLGPQNQPNKTTKYLVDLN